MFNAKRWSCFFVAIAVVLAAAPAESDVRTWSDVSGKFSIEAEFVRVDGEQVVLLKADGRELKVPRVKLSKTDRDFLDETSAEEDADKDDKDTIRKRKARRNQDEKADTSDGSQSELVELANTFYEDLRHEDRKTAGEMLTPEAIKASASGASPLKALPTPDKGGRALRPGKAIVDGDVAEVPMRVKAGGKMHETKLHFRNEDDAWRVFAISATFPEGEKTINFEAVAQPTAEGNPLEKLVGNAAQLTGFTLDGRQFDLAHYQGKVVLIDFWATWCGPCRAEMPNILANYKQYHEAGFEVVAVSVDKDLNAIQEFVAEEQPPWTVVADNHPNNKRSMAASYGVSGIPAFVLVGQSGEVVAVNCRGARLGKELEKLLNPAAGGKWNRNPPAASVE